jgi:S-adenosylmethionine hydrolase
VVARTCPHGKGSLDNPVDPVYGLHMRPVFVLLTDFGHTSPYVGQMHGVLLSGCRNAAIIDLCHSITPHSIVEGALMLQASIPFLPPESIVLAVVDPGVGTQRPLIILETPRQHFLAPDNGILALLAAHGRIWDILPAEAASSTFHGRDILARVAVRLACGEPLKALATLRPHGTLHPLPSPPYPKQEGFWAQVVHVDHFGNCLLDVPSSHDLPTQMLVCGRPARTVRTYADLGPGEVGLVRSSQGVWEIAANQASAAQIVDLSPGKAILLSPLPSCSAESTSPSPS